MSRIHAALIASALSLAAIPTASSARCHVCYAPPPCNPCYLYQPQFEAAQFGTVQEIATIYPSRATGYQSPALFSNVNMPRTLMVAPAGFGERIEMVAPAQTYYAPIVSRCGSCRY